MSHYSNLYMFVTTLVVEVLVPKVIVSGGLQRNTGRSQTTKQTPFLWVVRQMGELFYKFTCYVMTVNVRDTTCRLEISNDQNDLIGEQCVSNPKYCQTGDSTRFSIRREFLKERSYTTHETPLFTLSLFFLVSEGNIFICIDVPVIQ